MMFKLFCLSRAGHTALSLFLFVWILAGGPSISASFASRDRNEATYLHILVVADSNDHSIGSSVAKDRDRVVELFEWGVPAARRSLTVLSGDSVTPENILAYYRKLTVQPTESLLFYYAGHGAWSREGHVLTFQDGLCLPRSTLVEAMQRKGAWLNVRLTDCCSTYISNLPTPKAKDVYPDVFRHLFFRHRGVVDITAAQEGQIALGDIRGGAFTRALEELLQLPMIAINGNKDGRLTWEELAVDLKERTSRNYHYIERNAPRGAVVISNPDGTDVRPSGPQAPHVFGRLASASPGVLAKSNTRFGIYSENAPGGGSLVTRVVDNSPADWTGFRQRDIIQEITPYDFLLHEQVKHTINTDEDFCKRSVNTTLGISVMAEGYGRVGGRSRVDQAGLDWESCQLLGRRVSNSPGLRSARRMRMSRR